MKQYFVDGAFKENHIDAAAGDKQIMACDPVQDTKIRNSTCVLAPETTEGPYYHTEGHPIRSNMAENELGLLFLMNVGVIDVETCEPVPDVLVDLWHANSTGYYAGKFARLDHRGKEIQGDKFFPLSYDHAQVTHGPPKV